MKYWHNVGPGVWLYHSDFLFAMFSVESVPMSAAAVEPEEVATDKQDKEFQNQVDQVDGDSIIGNKLYVLK